MHKCIYEKWVSAKADDLYCGEPADNPSPYNVGDCYCDTHYREVMKYLPKD